MPSASMSEAKNTNDNPPATSVGSMIMIGGWQSVRFGPGEEIKLIIVNNCVNTNISIIIKPPINVGWVTNAGQQLQQPVASRAQIKIPIGPRAKNPENTVCTPLPSTPRKRLNKAPSSSPVFKRPRAHLPVGRDCAVDSAARAVTCAAPVECSVLLNEEMRENEVTIIIVNESDESRTISSYSVQPDRPKTMPLNVSDSMDRSGDVPKGILTVHVSNCDLSTFFGTTIDERDEKSKRKLDHCSISSLTKLQKTTDQKPGQPRKQPFSKEERLRLTSVYRKKSQVKREHIIVVTDSNKNSPLADVGSSPSLVISVSLADISSLSAKSTTPSADPSSPLTDISSLSPIISSTPSNTNSSSTILRLPPTDPTSPHIIGISLPNDIEKLWSYLYSPSGVDINTPSVDVNSTSANINLRPASTAVSAQTAAEWFSQWTDVDDDQPEERPMDEDHTVSHVSVDVGVPAAACTLSGEPKQLAKVRHESCPEKHVDGKRNCSPVMVVLDDPIGIEQEGELLTFDCGNPANNKVPNEDDDDNRYSVEWVGLDDVRRFSGESANAERSETPKQPVEVQRNDGNEHTNSRISNKQRISEKGYITSNMHISGKSCFSGKERISGQEFVSRNIQISGTDCVTSKDCISSTSHVVTGEEQQRIVCNNCVVTDERISGNSHVSVDKRISGHVYATSAKYISGTSSVFNDMRISDNSSVANKECIPFGRIFVVDKRIPNIDQIAVRNEPGTGKSSVSENECDSIKKWISYNDHVVSQDRICYNSRVFVVDKRISNSSRIADDKYISHNSSVANEKHISYNERVFVVNKLNNGHVIIVDKLNNDNVAANNHHISGKGPDAFNEARIPDHNHVISVEHNYDGSRVFDDDCLLHDKPNFNYELTSDAWIKCMEACQPPREVLK